MKRLPDPPIIPPLETPDDVVRAIKAIMEYLNRLKQNIEPTLPAS